MAPQAPKIAQLTSRGLEAAGSELCRVFPCVDAARTQEKESRRCEADFSGQ
jgi:hypothetical protein